MIPKVSETTKTQGHLGRRDAFHVPGILVRSNQSLRAGDRVMFVDEALAHVEVSDVYWKTQAIVDPFLPPGVVSPGTLFWVFPLPGSTGPVRHHFDVNIDPVIQEDDDDYRTNDADCKGCYE